jgi:NAD(P)-dependent dehydrogenase (short-subunit alcohol dehydrogenase family)
VSLPVQYGYRMSKTALNMAGKLLAEDLAAQEIPVGIVHPGPVSDKRGAGNGRAGRMVCVCVWGGGRQQKCVALEAVLEVHTYPVQG